MKDQKRTIIALGMFDGVHIGHQRLLRRTKEMAESTGCASVAFTFSNHPMEVLGGTIALLTTFPERERLMLACGIDEVDTVPFTAELANLAPEAFFDMLSGRFSIAGVVVGFNYTFGKFGAGTPETLCVLGKERGFFVQVMEPVLYGGLPVSSSRIRQCVEDGDMRAAADMMQRPYRMNGTVVSNLQNGRRLGFPTANLMPDPTRACPKHGVYAVRAAVCGTSYPAVTNVGTNPTMRGGRLTIETHIPGFDCDVYGEELTLDFVERIRDEFEFESESALKRQIQKDVAYAKRVVV